MSLIGKLVGKLLTKGRITLKTPGRPPQTFGPGGGKHLTVRFTDKRVAFDIIRNPRLGFGETYMDGRLVIEDGTILDLMRMIVGANRWEDWGKGRKTLTKRRKNWLKRFSTNNLKRARKNVAHHYDLSDDLYELFLDEDKQYSCAYFTDPKNSLEQAQLDKKAHIAAKLALEPGQRVLDIGCGWGGMALFLHKVAGVDVLGVTLSEHQLRIARERAKAAGVSDHVKFELIDYRLLDQQFDRIVSVGMFEHVGAKHYDEFFAKCRDLLKPDGVMLLHTIGKLGEVSKGPDPFTDKYIFPGYHLPSLSEMTAASQNVRMIASDIENLRLHYALTRALARPRDQGAQANREDVRRALLPYVGILSRRRNRDVRRRRRLQLPGPVHPRPPSAAHHARLYGRSRSPLPQARRRTGVTEADAGETSVVAQP